MKRTPFHSIHIAQGAKLVEFAGFEMPIQYEGIVAEHLAVRKMAGVFDVSHMGEFWVKGNDALKFVEYVTTNSVRSLQQGQVQYSVMCYENGGIVDDLLVYRFADSYLLVVNGSNIEKDWQHLEALTEGFDIVLENASDATGLLALQGPSSRRILSQLTAENLDDLEFYHFVEGEVAGFPMIISRTGYTGELGYELYHAPRDSEALWHALFKAGESYDIRPVGLGARDTLRLEMKFCLYGNDIDASTNPLEARLAWVVDLDGPEFVGQKALQAIKTAGIQRYLVAFSMQERGLPRHGYPLMVDGQQVGEVTSGGQSPSLKQGIGMGYVNTPFHKRGTRLDVSIRDRMIAAEVVKPPFLKKQTS